MSILCNLLHMSIELGNMLRMSIQHVISRSVWGAYPHHSNVQALAGLWADLGVDEGDPYLLL